MATQWLYADKTSGKGDGQITLSSQPWDADLKKQTATVKISGLYTNTYITAVREGVTPIVTIEGSKFDFTSVSGTATFKVTSNVHWAIVKTTLPDWITLDIYDGGNYTSTPETITVTMTIAPNKGEKRSGKIRLTDFVYEEFNFGEIYVSQSEFSYEDWGYVELIYETDEDNQNISLFGVGGGESHKGGSYLKYQVNWSESRKTPLVTEIIIDGVVQDWDTADSFLIEKAGEHTVYVLFTDNTIEANWRSHLSGMVGGSGTWHHQYPFWGNQNLKRAKIPSIVSYGESNSLFRECPRLESIEIGDESCMCDYMAYKSTALETITYPTTITSIPNYAFAYNAANVSYKNFVTDSITTIGGGAFAYSNIVGDITDNNITHIGGGAFTNCTSLDGTVLDLSGITVGTGAFNDCTQYKEVIIDDKSNTNAFGNIGGTVYVHCSIGSYFLKCLTGSKFTKVVMDINPSVVNSAPWFSNGYVEEVEFLNTTPNWYYDFGGSNFGNYFQDSPTIKKITIHSMTAPLVYPETFGGIGLNGTLVYPSDADYSSWLAEDRLGQYGWNGQPMGLTTDNFIMYKTSNNSQYNPTTVVADANITETIYDNSSGYFFMCFDAPITTIKKDAFSNSNITALVLPNTVTTLEDYIFYRSNITEFIVPDSVTTIEDDALAVSNKTIKKLTIGGGVKIVDGGYWDTFISNLEELTLREGVEQLTWNAYGLKSLTKVSLPSTLTVLGNDCFDSAKALDLSTVFHKDLNITTIGSYAFRSTKTTGALILPPTLTSIGSSAFSSCEGLNEIYSYATVAPTTETDSFNFCKSGTLYYPAGSDYSEFLAKLNKSSSYNWVGQEITE